jgi:hypothetical protein
MEAIWKDLDDMMTPSWLASVPKELGQASHGKLKADQYRVLATTYLPVSLVRLWGLDERDDSPRGERRRALLKLTMNLFSAVSIATARSTSRERAGQYLFQIQSYINGLKTLFPKYEFRPNHHMALHIYDCLLRFGPAHSWWTYPFERVIGMLQRIPTSGKFGEMEETMARGFSRSSNLRAIFTSYKCPEVIQHTAPFFNKLVNVQTRGTLVTDILSFATGDDDIEMGDAEVEDGGMELEPGDTEFDISKLLDNPDTEWIAKNFHPLRDAVLQQALRTYFGPFGPKVDAYRPLQNLSINNLNYSTFEKHRGNSNIMISSPMFPFPVAARIFHIFQIRDSKNKLHTLLAVRRHLEFQSEDPFQNYPALRMRLWLPGLIGLLEVIDPKDVLYHFASLPMAINRTKVVATISLSRVSPFLVKPQYQNLIGNTDLISMPYISAFG